ncbi:DinB family protein [Paenibacillus sp. N4]|uniref:DinB family protein n=1 Tax=Paenibacillus vietnamensis TaxID=2590547 RepID=UPI001CD0DCAD|nr:DinB family protein [Paenibacillus vietnamensis]MCA0756208.1 DinB family protein [Paenibacillus vietnamensis]
MTNRPLKEEYNPYYEQYIRLVREEDIIEVLADAQESTDALLAELTEEQGNYRYADGKWSLKEVIGHVADGERIMSYRLLRASRGDKTPLAGFDQDEFMTSAPFASWTMEQIREEYVSVRRATLSLLRGLTEDAWTRSGIANGSNVSARALAYIIAGHELHHLRIIKERYLR